MIHESLDALEAAWEARATEFGDVPWPVKFQRGGVKIVTREGAPKRVSWILGQAPISGARGLYIGSVAYREHVIKAHIWGATDPECEQMLETIIQVGQETLTHAGFVPSNEDFSPGDDIVMNRGEIAVLSFTLRGPVMRLPDKTAAVSQVSQKDEITK